MLFIISSPFTTSVEERERCYSFFLFWIPHERKKSLQPRHFAWVLEFARLQLYAGRPRVPFPAINLKLTARTVSPTGNRFGPLSTICPFGTLPFYSKFYQPINVPIAGAQAFQESLDQVDDQDATLKKIWHVFDIFCSLYLWPQVHKDTTNRSRALKVTQGSCTS
jgi:hypothetical protein